MCLRSPNGARPRLRTGLRRAPSRLHVEHQSDFDKRSTKIIGLSVDPPENHVARAGTSPPRTARLSNPANQVRLLGDHPRGFTARVCPTASGRVISVELLRCAARSRWPRRLPRAAGIA
jgi:hypothetical protein